MCLVFLAFQVDDAHPVLLGANREESRSRPGTPPVCCRTSTIHALLAGADHGPDGAFPQPGTWLGVNAAGLVVAVTNRRDGVLAWAEQIHSRGLLAVSLLDFERPESALRFARRALSDGGFGGSNFLIANPGAAYIIHAPGAQQITEQALRPGVHAITNLDLDDPSDPRIALVREQLEPGRFVASAQQLCRDGRIVIDGAARGTVSSSLVLIGSEIGFYHVMGDPRAGPYEAIRPFCSG